MKEEKGKNFKKDVQMHLACLKDDVTRPLLGCIYIKNGYAYAGDSTILVKNDLRESTSRTLGRNTLPKNCSPGTIY